MDAPVGAPVARKDAVAIDTMNFDAEPEADEGDDFLQVRRRFLTMARD